MINVDLNTKLRCDVLRFMRAGCKFNDVCSELNITPVLMRITIREIFGYSSYETLRPRARA